ncbi:MAG: hypothetical protein JXA46_11485 [Dehalococcoidales bacterium]|nr:hypothetical protein [Dehalococcoidales bacterium]
MEDRKLLCRNCRHIFRLSEYTSCSLDRKVLCPNCSSTELSEAPAWAPLGSGTNIFEGSCWKYECKMCGHKFEMPVPKSPSENKSRRCPRCGGAHLHLITDVGALPLYCG